jgi:hypothetical protein
MSEAPVPRDPGQHDDRPGVPAGPGDRPRLGSPHWRLVPQSPDWPEWMDADAHTADEDPGDPDDYEDPDSAPPPGLDDAQLEALLAEAEEITADQARAAEAAARSGHAAVLAAVGSILTGRRGPGMPGSAQAFPGVSASPAAGFASGMPLDAAPGCATLASFLEDTAGDDRYVGATDDELLGVICAWDRTEANASAGKHAAIAEFIRRRPAPGAAVAGPAQMPEDFEEFTGRELGTVLGVSQREAGEMLDLAWYLEVSLPGTKAAFRSGIVSRDKAAIIASAIALLDPAEARAAEAMVLDRAGSLTPPALRAAIQRAVMEVAPGKARKRREHMAKRTRVERWAEDSGNAGLAGRELPPAEVLAADERVTAWAKQLRKAGLEGGMDQLRARAYLDILLGIDSRPLGSDPDGIRRQDGDGRTSTGGSGHGGPGPHAARTPAPAGPLAGVIPPGFAGRVTLTVPAVTLTGLAGRPGELAGIGPIDPDLARDLASAAARNPKSTWCVTVTDSQGHAIGHGCARPAPASPARRHKPDTSGGPDPPGRPRFTFTPTGQPGPPGGYGTWRFSTGIPGQRDLLIDIGPLPAQGCDHRHEANGHDPGVMLRHLAQVRHATCTGPGCRRPAANCDFEHNVPYEAGGRTCMCNGNPKCRFDHRLKQDPRWNAEQLDNGNVRWTTPSGRQYVTEPTRYPI